MSLSRYLPKGYNYIPLTPDVREMITHTWTNLHLKAAGLFHYVWPFSGHHALKSFSKTWKGNKNMFGFHKNSLKFTVQSCKLYNNKYMMASKQRTTTAIFAFITVLAFKLLSRKVLFMDRKAESCRFKYVWPFCYQQALKG